MHQLNFTSCKTIFLKRFWYAIWIKSCYFKKCKFGVGYVSLCKRCRLLSDLHVPSKLAWETKISYVYIILGFSSHVKSNCAYYCIIHKTRCNDQFWLIQKQAHNQLGTPEGKKSFLRGAKFWNNTSFYEVNHHLVKEIITSVVTYWLQPCA